MAIPTPTRAVDGAVANVGVFSNFSTEYGAWLNSLEAADFATRSVRTEHVVRPVIRANELRCERQILQWASFGLQAGPANLPNTWASRPRLTVPVAALRASETAPRWVSPLGFRLVLPDSAAVRVWMTWEFHVRSITPNALWPLSPLYPRSTDADGVPTVGGHFSLVTRRRYTLDGESLATDATDQGETRVYVYPLKGDALDKSYNDGTTSWSLQSDRGALLWAPTTLQSGVWDLNLAYTGGSGHIESLLQIDISAFSATLEALM